jgi:acetyltransferase-like isoleucine patch superfamily enzyme
LFNFNKWLDRILNNYLESYLEKYLSKNLLSQHLVFGDKSRLKIAETAIVNNALLNLSSGDITIEDYVFFGHNVSVITGTHDYHKFRRERQVTIPKTGRDVVIKEGAWIASNVTILGPCTIGEHSVVAAGALVKEDVPPYTIVAGLPARVIKKITNVNNSVDANHELLN